MDETVTNKDTEEKSRDVLIYHFIKWQGEQGPRWVPGATIPKTDEVRPTYITIGKAITDLFRRFNHGDGITKPPSMGEMQIPYPKREIRRGDFLDLKERIRAATVAIDVQTGTVGVSFCSVLDQSNRYDGRDVALRKMALKIDWKLVKESKINYFRGRLYFHPLKAG
jgi:hypothetical protein